MELFSSRCAPHPLPAGASLHRQSARAWRTLPDPRETPIAAPATHTIFLVHKASRQGSPIRVALEERGYQVIHANSVEEAVRVWSRLAARVDLFLADISLGRDQAIEELVKLLQAENPRMRVLFANDLEQLPGAVLVQTYPKQLVGIVDNCLG